MYLFSPQQYVSKVRRLQSEGERTGLPADLTGATLSPGTVAQQLTHVELQYLSFIGPDEFVNAFARDLAKPNLSEGNSTRRSKDY